jgi:hypothetical protein
VIYNGVAFFCFVALRVLAFAAAFEAFVAISLRCFALNAFARALPPRLPISFRNLATGESFINLDNITLSAKIKQFLQRTERFCLTSWLLRWNMR